MTRSTPWSTSSHTNGILCQLVKRVDRDLPGSVVAHARLVNIVGIHSPGLVLASGTICCVVVAKVDEQPVKPHIVITDCTLCCHTHISLHHSKTSLHAVSRGLAELSSCCSPMSSEVVGRYGSRTYHYTTRGRIWTAG